MNHILDFSSRPARLHVRDGLLHVDVGDDPPATVPLGEIAAVVLAHPQITCTRAVLSGLAAAGAALVICDERFMPAAMSLPLTGYHAPARRMLAQAAAPAPKRKRLWQSVVRAKVRAQGRLLKEVRGDDFGLAEMARAVRSGDPENIEAQASRVYWPALFDDLNFARRVEAQDQNRYLNYGYAVLRAIVARAICAAGLHPGLGIHHHHRENAFCLADDLMESFRPQVDRCAVELLREVGPDAPLDPATKPRLLRIAEDRYEVDGEHRSLFDVTAMMASSLAQVFEGHRQDLVLPEL